MDASVSRPADIDSQSVVSAIGRNAQRDIPADPESTIPPSLLRTLVYSMLSTRALRSASQMVPDADDTQWTGYAASEIARRMLQAYDSVDMRVPSERCTSTKCVRGGGDVQLKFACHGGSYTLYVTCNKGHPYPVPDEMATVAASRVEEPDATMKDASTLFRVMVHANKSLYDVCARTKSAQFASLLYMLLTDLAPTRHLPASDADAFVISLKMFGEFTGKPLDIDIDADADDVAKASAAMLKNVSAMSDEEFNKSARSAGVLVTPVKKTIPFEMVFDRRSTHHFYYFVSACLRRADMRKVAFNWFTLYDHINSLQIPACVAELYAFLQRGILGCVASTFFASKAFACASTQVAQFIVADNDGDDSLFKQFESIIRARVNALTPADFDEHQIALKHAKETLTTPRRFTPVAMLPFVHGFSWLSVMAFTYKAVDEIITALRIVMGVSGKPMDAIVTMVDQFTEPIEVLKSIERAGYAENVTNILKKAATFTYESYQGSVQAASATVGSRRPKKFMTGKERAVLFLRYVFVAYEMHVAATQPYPMFTHACCEYARALFVPGAVVNPTGEPPAKKQRTRGPAKAAADDVQED